MDERLDAMLRDAREGLARSKVPAAEAFVHASDRGFARFSRGELDQHVELEERRAVVRVAHTVDGRSQIASVTTSDISASGIARAATRASEMAKVTPVTEGWPGFATRDEPAPASRSSIAATMRSAEERAGAVGRILETCRERSLAAAGAFESSEHRTALVNTLGLERAQRTPFATCKVFALDAGGSSGFAQQTRRSAADIDVDAIASRAVDKCMAGRDPVALPPGEYDVVLEPSAVVELLEWLAFTTFGAREVADGTSAFAGRIGERVTGSNVTLRDEGAGDRSFSSAFDREGTARSSLVLIDRGVATSVAYDRLYAAREGRASTGNAAPPSSWDDAPIAQSLVMDGGSDTLESLVSKVDRGLWITRFHYVNGFLDPRRTLMTGLTRDGTFVIDRGARGRGVRNMRFTDSVFEALSRCEGLSSLIEAVPTWWSDGGAFYAPAVLLRGLRFSGGGVDPPPA